MNVNYSFIVLTLNEELHLERLLSSIVGLGAKIFVLDSGSTDRTLEICRLKGIEVKYNTFVNHPEQWDFALHNFKITTPWTIGLDADQVLSTELYQLLARFENSNYHGIDGIYFNRKNYFQKQWIKYGGYYPMYLLKMFRTDVGYSDLSEKMDHRFQVPGQTITWKHGHIIEENLKENNIDFWITKHNIYSTLTANTELLNLKSDSKVTNRQGIWGTPNQRKAWKKQLWKNLPRFIRPLIYIFYRLIIQRGILDGKKGILFHFLQGFWFRIIIDMKIEELIEANQSTPRKLGSTRFILKFLFLLFIFYYFNIAFISASSPGGFHIPFLETHLNYIQALREIYILVAAFILTSAGYTVVTSPFGLTVLGFAGFKLVYSCLAYGVISCFSAFALSIPKPFRYRYQFLILGIASIFILNICRLIIVAIYYRPNFSILGLDHHDIFNIVVYTLILACSYICLKYFRKDE
jgi:exosortase/archaeosortase family protein